MFDDFKNKKYQNYLGEKNLFKQCYLYTIFAFIIYICCVNKMVLPRI